MDSHMHSLETTAIFIFGIFWFIWWSFRYRENDLTGFENGISPFAEKFKESQQKQKEGGRDYVSVREKNIQLDIIAG